MWVIYIENYLYMAVARTITTAYENTHGKNEIRVLIREVN